MMTIDFRESEGMFSGTDELGRAWRITPIVTGWRLEFSDPGDAAHTNAGVHSTLASAQAEASQPMSRRRR